MPAPTVLIREILVLLAEHSPQGLDYISIFMFLNTVAGGHYEERYPEAEIRAAVTAVVERGWVAVAGDDGEGPQSVADSALEPADLGPGAHRLHLTDSGRAALVG